MPAGYRYLSTHILDCNHGFALGCEAQEEQMPPDPTTEAVRRQFGATAEAYAVSAVHASGPNLEALIEAARLTGKERVLDLGSGAGHTALRFARAAGEVVGVDVTAEMVAVATRLAHERELANVSFREADAARLPFADATFDVVVSRFSAHHYGSPEGAVREAARVLRPGGAFLLVDTVAPEDEALDRFFNAFELLRDPSHHRNWRVLEWQRFLQTAGFRARTLERWSLWLDGRDWVKRMQTPPTRVAMLRELFATADERTRQAFEVHDEPWSFSIPIALIEGVKADAVNQRRGGV